MEYVSPTGKYYCMAEKQVLAVIWATEKFLLLGKKKIPTVS